MDIIAQLGLYGVVPVVKIENAALAPALARALSDGGLPCVEITFRTAAAPDAIRAIRREAPGMLIGAGTVLTLEQAEQALAAGAVFMVSPGFDPLIVDWCRERSIPVIPGVATATEALQALGKGLHVLKFFPSEALGGIKMLEALSAALPGVKFLPTGGVSPANMAGYLKLPCVHAVAGTWLATARTISGGAFDEITRLANEAVAVVQSVRMVGEPT